MMPPPLGPIATVRCCRDWPVYVQWQWRRCGLCGERPVLVEEPQE